MQNSPSGHLESSAHSSASRQYVPVESSLNLLGQMHLKLPRVLTHLPGLEQKPGLSHSLISEIQKSVDKFNNKLLNRDVVEDVSKWYCSNYILVVLINIQNSF